MAINSHAPRPDVGHVLSVAMGRPAYDAAEPGRKCRGVVFGRRCERHAVWLLPETDYCGTHIPQEYLATVTARRDLWIALSGDIWRDVLAEYPLNAALPDGAPPPSRYREHDPKHDIRVSHDWPPTFIMCECGAEFEHRRDARPGYWDHRAAP